MTAKVLINTVTIENASAPVTLRSGSTITDATIVSAAEAVGGVFAPANDPIIAAAAVIATKMRGRAQNEALIDTMMVAAYASVGGSDADPGIAPLRTVRLATAAALPAGTYDGDAQTFTVTATGTLTVDGKVTALGDRILVKDQATGSQNGLYEVTTAGATGVKAVLTRAGDGSASGDFQPGMLVGTGPEGTANASTALQLTATAPVTLDTTALTFSSIGAASLALATTAPVDVDTTAAATGVGTKAARNDHKHHIDAGDATTVGVVQLDSASPADVGAAAVAGSGGLVSDSAHVHADPMRKAAGTGLLDAATQTIDITGGNWRTLAALGQGGALTVDDASAVAGDQIDITRHDVSAFTYDIINGGVGAGTLCQFPVSKQAWARLQFDGTNWVLRGLGTI